MRRFKLAPRFLWTDEFYSGLQIVHSSKFISFFLKALLYVVGTQNNFSGTKTNAKTDIKAKQYLHFYSENFVYLELRQDNI